MEFEKQLRDRIREERIKKIEEDFQRRWNGQSLSTENMRGTEIESIKDAYSIYIENKLKDMTKRQLFEIYDEFEQAISASSLMKLKERIKLEEREKAYIKYKEQCSWLQDGRCKSYFRSSNKENFIRKIRLTIN